LRKKVVTAGWLGAQTALPRAFHANRFVVAQSGRTLICGDHTQTYSARVLRSVRDLIKAINDYERHYNQNPRPFQWVASARRIIRKVSK
jgi:hypothetical protein